MKIKNIEKTAERIKTAIKEKEKIVLYGDADLDGTTSVVMLKEAIEKLNGEVSCVYFPDRGSEGYGLNFKAIEKIKNKIKEEKALLIVMDCGIANFKEAEKLKEDGISLIIIDHHQPHDELPDAEIVVAPKQKEDSYPFKDFANAGIILKLTQELLQEKFIEKRKSFVELAMMATISDMMKQESENKDIIDEGLAEIETTERLGLKVFWEMNLFEEGLEKKDLIQRIISILNASEIVSCQTEAYQILISEDSNFVKNLVSKLNNKNQKKQDEVDGMVEEVMNSYKEEDKVIFEGKNNWNPVFLGSAASKINNKTKKPVFLYRKGEVDSRGAVRMPSNFNAVDLMEKSADILLAYGGHPPAAGFSIENKNIEEFKRRLINYFEKN